METSDTVGSLPIANPELGIRWFCQYGCVVERDGVNRVFIGDRLLGEYDPRDPDLGPRNVMLVMLARQPKIHLGQLAAAFKLSNEQLRRLRQAAEADGYGAVLTRARGCSKRAEISPAKVRELRALFEEGWNPTEATRRQRRRGRVSRSTVSRERRQWEAEKQVAQGRAAPPVVAIASRQVLFEDGAAAVARGGEERPSTFVHANIPTLVGPIALDSTTRAMAVAAVDTVDRAASTATDVLAKATHDALATSGNGVTLDALAAATDTMTAAVVTVDMLVGPANTDGPMAELAITGDAVAAGITDAIADEGCVVASGLADDGVATDAFVTEVTAVASDDLEPLEAGAADALAGEEYHPGPVAPLRSRPVEGGRLVQHVGSWLLMALAQHHGLHQEAEQLAGGDATRIAIDATLAALAIGECTVEGVRRLATSTAPLLLRCAHTPTASTVRRRLHAFADEHGPALMARIGERYLEAVRAETSQRAVFYVDNHMRKYTGQEVVRYGWRMQDKRAMPGASDYYVHDESGRPVFRIDTPSHDSLCQWLMPIVTRLRVGLGAEEKILLVFDRAGAFPDEMATLRDAGVEFATYERRPYSDLALSAFDRTIAVRGETYGVHESRLKNLGDGRGRVRRIALRAPDGKQINLLAVSTAPLEQLVGFLMGKPDPKTPSGRWQQENAFKHEAERWGINQLDGRKVEPYPPGTIIPNPAHRRNERALKIAHTDEGRARRVLADKNTTDKRRTRAESELADAIQRRVALELARPLIPKHAPIEQTELAGKLVRHPAKLKAVVDTMRIVCANVEAELADIIALALKRPREAKKVIANVFAAPGRVDVTASEIRVRLSPAANRSEHAAIQRLLADITARKLTLPGDARRRPLRFELHVS
jgi:hypothetical protein